MTIGTANTTLPRARHAGAAGVAAAAAGLAISELVAHAWPVMPSVVIAVGGHVIDAVPDRTRSVAIEELGAADKPVLLVSIVAATLCVGALTGLAARRHARRGTLAVAVVAAVVAVLTAGRPGVGPGAAVAASASLAAVWALVLSRLLVIAPRSLSAASSGLDVSAGEVLTRRRFVVLTSAVFVLSGGVAAIVRSTASSAGALAARAAVILPAPRRRADPLPPGASLAVAGITPLITSNRSFYRIDTALRVPAIDPADWRIAVAGMVERPYSLTFSELVELGLVEVDITLACVSNPVGGELVGTARWLGVPLRTLLERARPQAGATQLVGRSIDGFTAGFPTALALDGRDAMVAVGMNGEPLPLAHGFPARLIVPGLYGYTSATKWLTRIELTCRDCFDAYWVPRGYAKDGPVLTQSRIDTPRAGRLVAAGPVVVAGVAWAPDRGVDRVEVRVDDGPWRAADLAVAVSDDTWRQWRIDWTATAGEHRLSVRATDGTGALQEQDYTRPLPSGATGAHVVRVTVA